MTFILFLIQALILLIIARAILSWIDPRGRNPISQLLYTVTEPILAPVRNLLGGGMGGMDFSPTIVVIVLVVLENVLGGRR